MDEINKLLGPWPLLQLAFGILILGVGAYVLLKGSQKNRDSGSTEDKRAEWEAYTQLRNIEGEAFKQTELLRSILDRLNNNADAMKALSAAIWNQSQGPGHR